MKKIVRRAMMSSMVPLLLWVTGCAYVIIVSEQFDKQLYSMNTE